MATRLTEVGGFRKRKVRLRIALVYPNTYETGMASLGLHTVYSLLNGYQDVGCERFFLGMRTSMESNSPLSSFDVIGFSLQYEMDYLNVLKILQDGGIELLRARRKRPTIIAGGPCCFNPLPLVHVVDLFVVGDLEPVAGRLVQGLLEGCTTAELASSPGLLSSQLMNPIRSARAMDLDLIPAPTNQPHPIGSRFRAALGSTFMVEISRGCSVRCRFCMYSHCTSPKRERSSVRIREIVEEGVRITGLGKVSLIGALVTDHSEIKQILSYLAEKGLTVSLPSIRAQGVDEEMLELIERLGVRTLTLAPEGSPRVRSILGKDLQEDVLRSVLEGAAEHGVRKLRLYFITGVPGENQEDLQYIVDLCKSLSRTYRERGAITASVNPLIPKAHTPAQFLPLAEPTTIRANYRFLAKGMGPRIDLKTQGPRESILQAYLALGNERTGRVLLKAFRSGMSLRNWAGFAEMEGDPLSRVHIPPSETPWDVVDPGIPRGRLRRQSDAMVWRNRTEHHSGKH